MTTHSDVVVPEDVVFHGFPTRYEVSAPAAPEFRLGADHVVLNVDAEVADVGHVDLVILRQMILHAAEIVAPKRANLTFQMRILERLLLQSVVEHVLRKDDFRGFTWFFMTDFFWQNVIRQ